MPEKRMPEDRTAAEIRAEWKGVHIILKNAIPHFKDTGRVLRFQECREALTAVMQADYHGEVIL